MKTRDELLKEELDRIIDRAEKKSVIVGGTVVVDVEAFLSLCEFIRDELIPAGDET